MFVNSLVGLFRIRTVTSHGNGRSCSHAPRIIWPW